MDRDARTLEIAPYRSPVVSLNMYALRDRVSSHYIEFKARSTHGHCETSVPPGAQLQSLTQLSSTEAARSGLAMSP
jgi:hypothetical protein